MFTSSKKLHKSEFPKILKNGKVIHSSHLYLRVVFDGKDTKLAFVVPKKIVKGAVSRNKIKRRGYNVLKELDIKSLKGIFFTKKGIKDVSYENLKAEIEEILSKI